MYTIYRFGFFLFWMNYIVFWFGFLIFATFIRCRCAPANVSPVIMTSFEWIVQHGTVIIHIMPCSCCVVALLLSVADRLRHKCWYLFIWNICIYIYWIRTIYVHKSVIKSLILRFAFAAILNIMHTIESRPHLALW